jgi:hypothetical protein
LFPLLLLLLLAAAAVAIIIADIAVVLLGFSAIWLCQGGVALIV